MATAAVGSTDVGLDIWLSKATNVLNPTEDWESIVGFCDRVNKDPEGPQTAIKLLLHKIQSPQEKESLLALTTLEACTKNCGRRFQAEIGKFRFLNEIIKLISPKFMGNQTSSRVKQKCCELLYSWSQVLDYEPKIKEAYQMLRKQSIIKEDPVVADKTMEAALEPPPPPHRTSIFDNDEKSKLLSRLLRSKNPDDLMAANRLIKNMVKQDEERTEKVSERIHQLDIVYNNVKLLNDMLHNCQPTGGATDSDREIMKELYDNLEKQRPKLFRLASDTDEADESGITEILKANDEVIKVMALYEDVMNKLTEQSLLIDATGTASAAVKPSSELETLHVNSANLSTDLLTDNPPSYAASLLDDQLLRLGLDGNTVHNGFEQQQQVTTSRLNDFTDLLSTTTTTTGTTVAADTNSLFGSVLNGDSSLPDLMSLSNAPPHPISTSLPHPMSTSLPPVQSLFNTQPVPPTQSFLPPQFHLASTFPPAQTTLPVATSFPSAIPAGSTTSQQLASFNTSASILQPTAVGTSDLMKLTQPSPPVSNSSSSSVDEKKLSSGLETLDALGQSVLQKSLSTATATSEWLPRQPPSVPQKIPMNQMTKSSTVTPSSGSTALAPSSGVTPSSPPSCDILPLTDVSVPLDTIQPGHLSPITAYDKNNIKIMFYFGKDRPRPDVQVIAVSVMSNNTSPVKGFVFQAAVPKVMKVKLQPASATDLPAYNPILPPAAITQVMLIAHRPQDKVLLKFKITYSLKDAMVTDVGEVQFTDQ